MRQTSFSFAKNYKKEFGGSLLLGKRKAKRPLSTKEPIHLVLKTDVRRLLSPHLKQLEIIFRQECGMQNIQIYDLSINWDHLHALIKLPSREAYVHFIRSVTSRIVTLIDSMDIKSGAKAYKCGAKGLFRLRPYTKVVSWGRELSNARRYHAINKFESAFGTHKRYEFMLNKKSIQLE